MQAWLPRAGSSSGDNIFSGLPARADRLNRNDRLSFAKWLEHSAVHKRRLIYGDICNILGPCALFRTSDPGNLYAPLPSTALHSGGPPSFRLFVNKKYAMFIWDGTRRALITRSFFSVVGYSLLAVVECWREGDNKYHCTYRHCFRNESCLRTTRRMFERATCPAAALLRTQDQRCAQSARILSSSSGDSTVLCLPRYAALTFKKSFQYRHLRHPKYKFFRNVRNEVSQLYK